MCATILKPVEAGHHHEKKGFFGWFNRKFNSPTKGYQGIIAKMLGKTGRYLLIYAEILIGVDVLYPRLPTSCLPAEDQGYIITNVQLPAGTSSNRTLEVIKQIEAYYSKLPGVANVVAITGFSFSGNGQNAVLVFTQLKDWSERGPD